jgi:hypothetical protein
MNNYSDKQKLKDAVIKRKEQNTFSKEDVDHATTELRQGNIVKIKSREFCNALVANIKDAKSRAIRDHDFVLTNTDQNAIRQLFDFENYLRVQVIQEEIAWDETDRVSKASARLEAAKELREREIAGKRRRWMWSWAISTPSVTARSTP